MSDIPCPFCGKTENLIHYKLTQLGPYHPGFIRCETCCDGVPVPVWKDRPIENELRAERDHEIHEKHTVFELNTSTIMWLREQRANRENIIKQALDILDLWRSEGDLGKGGEDLYDLLLSGKDNNA